MMTDSIVAANGGIQLDIGCGENKQPGFVGMDVRPLDGVDIVHDLNLYPWPLPDECAVRAVASHLAEHIPPFSPDPKLIGLIRLLVDKGILMDEEAEEYMGEWNNPTPGFIRFMDEVWRVLKPGAQFALAVPHAISTGFPQDPTHINAINEVTWAYFDPHEPSTGGGLWQIYRPKPWQIKYISWDYASNVEVILIKREEESDAIAS